MNRGYLDLYKKLLFTLPQTTPVLKTYAVIDSIRDAKVKEKILFSGLNHTDLWHEDLFENEQEVPLYLIELEKNNALLDYLLNNHKKSIATYFISPYSLETLQMYYSVFTYVSIEVEEGDFQKGIFGFYDPNILPNYIQTLCTIEKIDGFFAGVAMWLSPSAEKADELYLAYRTKEGEVDDVNLQLSNLLKEENPRLNFDDASLPTEPDLAAYAHEVEIDHTQVKMFDDMEKRRFIDDIFREYEAEGYVFDLDEKKNKRLAMELMSEAQSLNIVSEAGAYRYILVGLILLRPMQGFKFYTNLIHASQEENKVAILNKALNDITNKRDEHGL